MMKSVTLSESKERLVVVKNLEASATSCSLCIVDSDLKLWSLESCSYVEPRADSKFYSISGLETKDAYQEFCKTAHVGDTVNFRVYLKDTKKTKWMLGKIIQKKGTTYNLEFVVSLDKWGISAKAYGSMFEYSLLPKGLSPP